MTDKTTQPADLLALVAKWRVGIGYTMHGQEWDLGYRRALETCAKELQAAIESLAAHRGEVEPVAWMVSKDGYHHFGTYRSVRDHAALDRDFKAGRLRLLYTHPPQAQAGAGDALIERLAIVMYAASFGFSHEVAAKRWSDVEQKSRFTEPVRAALEASHEPE